MRGDRLTNMYLCHAVAILVSLSLSSSASSLLKGFEVIVPGNATMEHTKASSRKDGGIHSIAPTHDGRIFHSSAERLWRSTKKSSHRRRYGGSGRGRDKDENPGSLLVRNILITAGPKTCAPHLKGLEPLQRGLHWSTRAWDCDQVCHHCGALCWYEEILKTQAKRGHP